MIASVGVDGILGMSAGETRGCTFFSCLPRSWISQVGYNSCGGSVANVELADGRVRRTEIHWYEATGIGRLEYKIKRYLYSMIMRFRKLVLCLRNDGYG